MIKGENKQVECTYSSLNDISTKNSIGYINQRKIPNQMGILPSHGSQLSHVEKKVQQLSIIPSFFYEVGANKCSKKKRLGGGLKSCLVRLALDSSTLNKSTMFSDSHCYRNASCYLQRSQHDPSKNHSMFNAMPVTNRVKKKNTFKARIMLNVICY